MKKYRVTIEVDIETYNLERAVAIAKESLVVPYKVDDIEVEHKSIDYNITRIDLINKGE